MASSFRRLLFEDVNEGLPSGLQHARLHPLSVFLPYCRSLFSYEGPSPPLWYLRISQGTLGVSPVVLPRHNSLQDPIAGIPPPGPEFSRHFGGRPKKPKGEIRQGLCFSFLTCGVPSSAEEVFPTQTWIFYQFTETVNQHITGPRAWP